GNLETLFRHKDMFFNSKFGRLGLISYPYWFFYEWLSPLLEFFGFITVVLFWYLGILNWNFFLALTAMIYTFSVMFSFYAVIWEVLTYNQYRKSSDMLKLGLCAVIEPFVFHPVVTWASVRGNYKKLMGRKAGWGQQVRKGLSRAA
ncbi:MAG: glycosyltransferase family 2 protein, partial [Bacteroidota bacterium]